MRGDLEGELSHLVDRVGGERPGGCPVGGLVPAVAEFGDLFGEPGEHGPFRLGIHLPPLLACVPDSVGPLEHGLEVGAALFHGQGGHDATPLRVTVMLKPLP